MARRKPRDWFVCPVCGEEVPGDALACPECGSDDRTGWSPETEHDGVDLPEPEGDGADAWQDADEACPGTGISAWVVVTVVLLLVLLVVLALAGAF